METHKGGKTGFSQISITFPDNTSGELLIPKVDQLEKAYPGQKALIERLMIKQ